MVELVVAVAVSSLFLGGIGSVVFVAGQGAALSGPTQDTIRTSEILHELTDEIRYAIYVTNRSTNMIEFAVADRNGDTQPDVIRYEWSGTQGDPLTRSFNHGSAQTVAENVYEFDLSYATQQTSEEIPGPDIESSEAVLIEHTASSAPAAADITTTNWIAQYFHPNDFNPPLPLDATSWKITKVDFRAKASGATKGQTWVQIRPATGDNKPTSVVLEQVVMLETNLATSFQWVQYPFASVSGLSPTQGHCLVLQYYWKSPAATVEHETVAGSGGRLDTQNDGATWTDHSPNSLFYRIYGTYTTPGPPFTITREYLTGVDASMQIGASSYTRTTTGTNLLNTPELLSAFWKLDFDEDPRTADSNFDGAGDWNDAFKAALDPATLSGGIWHSPKQALLTKRQYLTSVPDNNFDKPTTVNVRYRDVSVGGFGTVFWLNAENTGGVCAGLCAAIHKPDADTQNLWVGEYTNNYRWDRIYPVAANDFIDLRLVVNPASDSYSVFINGVFMATFVYQGGYTVYPQPWAWIYSEDSAGEFDSVSIRVSE